MDGQLWFNANTHYVKEGVTPDVVTRKLLDKYKGYWEYWKEDNSTNRLFWGSSVTRMDEIYFSP